MKSKNLYLANGQPVRVDAQDYDFLAQFDGWYGKKQHGKFHAYRKVKVGEKTIGQRMQRLLTQANTNEKVMFKDGDTLNLTRANLKLVKTNPRTNKQEEHFRGVSRRGNRFRSRIYVNGAEINLGSFTTSEEAALAYDTAAKCIHGTRAITNS